MTPQTWSGGFTARRSGQRPQVCTDGTIRLQGEREWLFEGSAEHVRSLLSAIPGAERLSETLLLLSFGNAVGVFEVPGLGRLTVVSGKWDERHYDRMLGDLTDIAAGLPFTSGVTSALPYDRSIVAREDVLYHAFVYLRHILIGQVDQEQRLIPALEVILRDPHRRFERVTRSTPVGRAQHIDAHGLHRLVSGTLTRAPGITTQGIPLARALRGHLPEFIEEPSVTASHDTPENRFVQAFLSLARGIVDGMRAAVGSPSGSFGRRVLADCDAMERLLRPISQHSFWQDVGPMIHVPVGSTVLQRRRGYRQVFGHWVRLRLSTRLPLAPERVRDLLEVKDIAELYELWCYFSVVREIETLIGPPVEAESLVSSALQVGVPWDFQVRWADGTRVTYNPRYSRSRSPARKSYSVPLRPDIGLEVSHGANQGLHLLDAKFKVDASRQAFGAEMDNETGEEEIAERRGVFKRGDLYKMHAYRDAISRARSVWILFPGTEFSFFSVTDGVMVSVDDLAPGLEGVGAIPHLPDAEAGGILRAVLQHLLGANSDPFTGEPRAISVPAAV
jgi:hypothetical protein